MHATVKLLKNPSAVELIDDIILDATKNNLEQVENRFFAPSTKMYFSDPI